jgi:DNA helicase-2/ATP-dependent DNA helicase PcrA
VTRPSTRTQVQTMKLDESQTQVASWVPAEGHLRVIGGAGSGKTGTLAMLVAKLVLVEGVSPESICVTTFGNKAGGELIARLEPLIGTEHLAAMSVGTFHSLGRRALAALDTKAWAMARCLDLGAKQRGSGVPSSKMLWRSALVYGTMPGTGKRSLRSAEVPDYHMQAVALARAGGETVITDQMDTSCRDLGRAWTLVEDSKKALKVWDFADVLEKWLILLRTRPKGWFQVVIVDEAQDNSKVRLDIARALAGTDGKLVLIGDLRQTIYSWSGAYPELFKHADVELKAKTLALGFNYRSTPAIVALTNDYARDKSWTLGPMAQPYATQGEPIPDPLGCESLEGLCSVWGKDVLAEYAAGNHGSRAFLFRTNGEAAVCEAAFMCQGIPCEIQGTRPILQSLEGKAVVNYVKAIWENDIRALSAVLNLPNRYIVRSFGEALGREVVPEGKQVEDVLRSLVSRSGLPRRVESGVRTFAADIRKLRRAGWEEGLDDLRQLLTASWQDVGEAHETDNVAVLAAVLGLAARFKTPGEFLAFADPTRRPVQRIMGPVTLSTVHRAKGLEWDTVHVHVTESYIPFHRAVSQEAQEEEERLLYVAMTRARSSLRLGYCEEGAKAGLSGGLSRLLQPFFPDADVGKCEGPF